MMQHWRHYNPQPQCDGHGCAKFIPYSRATLCIKSDGMPEPSPIEYWAGLCVRCEEKENALKEGET